MSDPTNNLIQCSEHISLSVEAMGESGAFPARIIVEGESLNRNAYYKPSAIESGLRIFAGAQVFTNHPTRTEEVDNPAGDVTKIVGRVTNTRLGQFEGRAALYGDVFISASEDKLRQKIQEGLITDLSINAFSLGEKDAKSGLRMVEAFIGPPDYPVPPPRVDIVTNGAAGGRFEVARENYRAFVADWLARYEEETNLQEESIHSDLDIEEASVMSDELHTEEENSVDVQNEVELLRRENEALAAEFKGKIDRISHAQHLTNWADLATLNLDADNLKPVRARIQKSAEGIIQAYVDNGGEVEQVKESIQGVIDAEMDYLNKIMPGGRPSGLTPPDQTTKTEATEASLKALERAAARLGK